MVFGCVHRLGESDVAADCGAEEIEDPEGGDYAEVEFSVVVSCLILFRSDGGGPVESFDGDIAPFEVIVNCLDLGTWFLACIIDWCRRVICGYGNGIVGGHDVEVFSS